VILPSWSVLGGGAEGIFLAGLKIDAVDDKGAEMDFADMGDGSDKRKKMVNGGYWFLDQGGVTPFMRA